MAINFFNKKGSGGFSNISIRNEFDDLLLGKDTGAPNGTTFLIRQVRIDANNQPIVCYACRHPITGEIQKDYPCSQCGDVGYFYDDVPVYGWKFDRLKSTFKEQYMPAGTANEPTYMFYFRSHEIVGRIDTIWELKHTVDGGLISPLQRLTKYNIVDVMPIRLDNSAIEFISVLTRTKDGAGANNIRLV